MSLFSTLTTGERKAQAAAICREIQALEDVEVDLGKKVSVPQDIMLEELSLASNRGSQLFKMRQKRSEKYTFENVNDDINSHLNAGMDAIASHYKTTDSRADNVNSKEERNCAEKDSSVDRACAPAAAMVPDPHSIAPGYGGPLKDVPPEKFNSTAIPKSYHSPWDLIREPALADTPAACLSEPEPPADMPGYKSFNRVAIPFGGFNETTELAAVQSMKAELALPDFPEIRGRPSFNRAAQGWHSTGASVPLYAVTSETTLAPESDDL